jgi:hypothetical protein
VAMVIGLGLQFPRHHPTQKLPSRRCLVSA